MRSAEKIVRTSIQRTTRLISLADPAGREALLDLLRTLREADRQLAVRLGKRMPANEVRFTEAQAAGIRAQVALVTQFAESRLLGLTEDQAWRAIGAGITNTASLITHLELAFKGAIPPLQIKQFEKFSQMRNGVRASLIGQIGSSSRRYGAMMTEEVERRLRLGIATGKTLHAVVDELVSIKGPRGRVSLAERVQRDGSIRILAEEIPEGLFVRYRYFAERIVRTEVANAYQAGQMESQYTARRELPDLQKKIMAHFDDRTAPDSIAVHGQIRPLEGMFIDGAGRQYLRPPARPNDRETIIPWRESWPENPVTRPKTAAEQAAAMVKNTKLAAKKRAGIAKSGAAQQLKIAKASAAGLNSEQRAQATQARSAERSRTR